MTELKASQEDFIAQAYTRLANYYGQPKCPLNYHLDKPYELAIAVILSAQCTDERVNLVTPELFTTFSTIQDYYKKPLSLLEKKLYSTGFYKNKAKNIRAFMKKLDSEYDGCLPEEINELIKFPGIGRKTANVVQNELFKRADGIVVDTHVARIVKLWQLTNAPKANAIRIERDLMQVVPNNYWLNWSLYLVFLGREFCSARKQLCSKCFLNDICPATKG